MALFSRRGKADDSTPEPGSDAAPESEGAVSADAPAADAEPVPHVGISVGTFGRPDQPARPVDSPTAPAGRPTPPRAPQEAPASTEAVAGIVDNTLLQLTLAALPAQPQSADVMNVMRQALQGPLYVRAEGDAQALLAAGDGLNLAITTYEEKRFLLAFSGGAPLQASASVEGAAATSAIGQPAHAVLRMAVDSGYDGVYLDHANPGARLVLPIELIAKALDEGAPAPFELKSLLSGDRDGTLAARLADALTRVPVWVAGNTDASGQIGLAEARGGGKRRLEIYSHPLEVLAMGRGDRPLPLTPEQLARTLASEPGLDGIVIDAAGPWIELSRDELAPVISGAA